MINTRIFLKRDATGYEICKNARSQPSEILTGFSEPANGHHRWRQYSQSPLLPGISCIFTRKPLY